MYIFFGGHSIIYKNTNSCLFLFLCLACGFLVRFLYIPASVTLPKLKLLYFLIDIRFNSLKLRSRCLDFFYCTNSNATVESGILHQ